MSESRSCRDGIVPTQIIEETAAQYGLAALLQEKPFNNINGSGKHNNWSIGTHDGVNLLNIGQITKAAGDDAFPTEWKSNCGRPTPSTRRASVAASARWRDDSTPSTRRRPRGRSSRNLTYWSISTQVPHDHGGYCQRHRQAR